MMAAILKLTVFCNWWTLRFFIVKLVKRLLELVPSAPRTNLITLIVVPVPAVAQQLSPYTYLLSLFHVSKHAPIHGTCNIN